MRRPTTPMGPEWDWWRAALAGERPPTHEGDPQPGFYKTRLCKGGPWVPAKIWWQSVLDPVTGDLVEPEKLLCLVNLEDRNTERWWTSLAKRPISRLDYGSMIDLIEWAGANDPTHPVLRPKEPIDLTRRNFMPCQTTR